MSAKGGWMTPSNLQWLTRTSLLYPPPGVSLKLALTTTLDKFILNLQALLVLTCLILASLALHRNEARSPIAVSTRDGILPQ